MSQEISYETGAQSAEVAQSGLRVNTGTVTVLSEAFGVNPATRVWLNPQSTQTSRYLRFGTQFTF